MAASASDTLDSLLLKYELAAKDCDVEISNKHLDKISSSCNLPYERLSPYLEMEQVCAQDIKQDENSGLERRLAWLKKWKKIKGSAATYRALILALLEIEYKDDAEKICIWLKTSNSATPASKLPSVPNETSSG